MTKNELKNFLESYKPDKVELLALLSSSAVARKYGKMKVILSHLKFRNICSDSIYEALLQTYLFAGYPSALISFKLFSEFFKSPDKIAEQFNPTLFFQRGEKKCKSIYGDKFEKLIKNVNAVSPELADWLIREGYGKVLGRNFLSLRDRECCIVAILTTLRFEDQLYSHINGAARLKVDTKTIKRIFHLCGLITSDATEEFGLKILEKYLTSKNSGRDL